MKEKDHNFRSDIAGLRALAVMLVILSHFQFYGFDFGFIGVDVFFVISGYLITRILYKEFIFSDSDPTKTFLSLTSFYLRRIRRLVPAAVVVIVLVNVVSFFVYNSQSRQELFVDSKWAFLFLANVSFLRSESDYFQQNNEPSMLQHYWSLSVEEQFYFIWPLLFLIAASMHKIKFRSKYFRFNKRILTLIGAISVVSFLFLQYGFRIAPTAAYFSIFTRAWELGVGSFFGILAFHKSKNKLYSRTERYFPLLATLIVSALFLTDDNWAKLIGFPVLATGFFLYAGQDQVNLPFKKPRIANLFIRITLFIGSISYSLYLVHWPLYVLVERLEFSQILSLRLLLIIASILFGYLLWKFIEIPFQRITLPKRPSWEPRAFEFVKSRKTLIAFLSLFFVGSLYLVTYPETTGNLIASDSNLKNLASDPAIRMYSEYQVNLSANSNVPVNLPALSLESSTISNGLSFSDLSRSLEDSLTNASRLTVLPVSAKSMLPKLLNDLSSFEASDCPKVDTEIPKSCSTGSLTADAKKVALIGDSKMGQFVNPLSDYFKAKGWFVQPMVMRGCVLSQPNNDDKRNCKLRSEWVLNEIKTKKFDLVISSEYPVSRDFAYSRSYFKKITTNASKVIIFQAHPRTTAPLDCIKSDNTFTKACQTIEESFQSGYLANIAFNRSLAVGNLKIIEAQKWVCVEFICPIFSDGVFITRDGSHMTNSYLSRITPLIHSALDLALSN